MIYVVSKQQELFSTDVYSYMSVEDSLSVMKDWILVQFDTETKGIDARISKVLCAQFGNKKAAIQIVVDTSTIDLRIYKEILESKLVIGQNLYFDLQFLFNYGIVCTYIYDTMIVEQLLYLGYPSVKNGGPSMGLAAISLRRLGINIDKSIRGKIIYLGLTTEVIKYAANDVVWLEDIMHSQVKELKEKNLINAAKVECNFVVVAAYTTWCGIKLDVPKWTEKMKRDEEALNEAVSSLNSFVIRQNNPKFINKAIQLDLFDEVNTNPESAIVWTKPGKKGPKGNKDKITAFIKYLGFDVSKLDKESQQSKDSIDLKGLLKQKGINDEFLRIYDQYSKAYKVVSTYGITYLNAINPITGRIHTSFKQLAADTGRIACGNGEDEDVKINPDLAKLKGFPLETKDIAKKCGYPNIQTLPADEITRTCFISESDNWFCSCDWSAIESRLGADIYNEPEMLKEFLEGSGDMHSLCAWLIFRKECEANGCNCVKDVKDKAPKWRKKVKPIEFSQQFGGSAEAIRNAMGCSIEEAQEFAKAYNEGFKGIAKFKEKGSKFVRNNGYILLNPITGHKTYWWDWKYWKEVHESFTPEFWDIYKPIKAKKLRAKSEGKPIHYYMTREEAAISDKVSVHFQAAAKWDRKALNSVTQGTGAICFKVAARKFFDWILANNQFGKVLIVDLVHDELCIEYPKSLNGVDKVLETIMQDTAAIYCKSLPIPAEAAVGDHWIH